jgi:hypothetical protein
MRSFMFRRYIAIVRKTSVKKNLKQQYIKLTCTMFKVHNSGYKYNNMDNMGQYNADTLLVMIQ